MLNLQGLTPTLEADGSVLLRGADGEPVYEIPAPYLADADGATSLEDAAYKLERISGGYLLTVEADPEWMNAPERAYPVTLDPTNSNIPVLVDNITDVAINGKSLGLGGYLDVGLYDTMQDLFVNFVGALTFSVIGYFSAKSGKHDKCCRILKDTCQICIWN